MAADRERLIHYARVMLREARARRATPFAATLLLWAGNARREAMRASCEPEQLPLL